MVLQLQLVLSVKLISKYLNLKACLARAILQQLVMNLDLGLNECIIEEDRLEITSKLLLKANNL